MRSFTRRTLTGYRSMGKISGKIIEEKLMSLLKQGITAENLALSLAIGITLGSFPLVGTTTMLCAAVALVFRMNFAAVQIGNWAAYPLQLALLAPFMIAGNYLFGSYPVHSGMNSMLTGNLPLLSGLKMISRAAIYGILVWAMAAPVFILSVYYCFLHVFRRWGKAWEA